jgi:hypothetical protein
MIVETNNGHVYEIYEVTHSSSFGVIRTKFFELQEKYGDACAAKTQTEYVVFGCKLVR